MQKVVLILSFVLTLASCGVTPKKLPCEPWGCKAIEYDPNPLCRFEKKSTSSELLEVILSDDPWDLYDNGYEVDVPYRFPLKNEPKELPPESYISPQCELTDEKAKILSCRGDEVCIQKLNQHKQMQQQVQKVYQGRFQQLGQQQQAQDSSLPECFFFDLFCF